MQLGRVCAFSHQIEFVDDGLLVFTDDLEWSQSFAVLPVSVSKACDRVQHVEIPVDQFADARSQHFDDDFRSVVECRSVYLCDRCRGKGLVVEAGEHLSYRSSIGLFQDADRLLGREWRHSVLQHCQFIGDIPR